MTGIVIALEREARPLLGNMEVIKQFELAGKNCYKGRLYGFEVYLIISDIGKVNAASATQSLLTRFPDITKILNIGVVGAVNKELSVCDICVAEKAIQYDFDVSAIDDVPPGYIQNIKQQYIYSDKKLYGELHSVFQKSVCVATADRFSFTQQDSETVSALGGDVRDMELGAIYQVCHMNNIPAVSIKSISDTAEGNPAEEFAENLTKATVCYESYIKDILEILNK